MSEAEIASVTVLEIRRETKREISPSSFLGISFFASKLALGSLCMLLAPRLLREIGPTINIIINFN